MFLVDLRSGWRMRWWRWKRTSVQLPYVRHRGRSPKSAVALLVKRPLDKVAPGRELLLVIHGVLFLQILELADHLYLSPVHPLSASILLTLL